MTWCDAIGFKVWTKLQFIRLTFAGFSGMLSDKFLLFGERA